VACDRGKAETLSLELLNVYHLLGWNRC